ncbi:LOW QUALITY PROTEIN: membrane progestin receptor delta-like [Hemitrygon akajei]|uniref:LOW QUALITY PROTEIN: membrane progestin receptor delta-like n=1 Tax=Hemitrygon akajei TaxID=2704970 RepID=UPI003BFA2AF9
MLTVKLPHLLSNHQVPKVFREDGIVGGYRNPQSSAKDCLLSTFQMTNETLNIWTHFLPTWYFLWRLLVLWHSVDFYNEPYAWPLLVYLCVSCLYPFTSSCAHTFSTMSAHARHVCYFFDYGALSLIQFGYVLFPHLPLYCMTPYIPIKVDDLAAELEIYGYDVVGIIESRLKEGCAITYRAYVMADSWVNNVLHSCFVRSLPSTPLVCTTLSCYSRFLRSEQPRLSKTFRLTAFTYPFLFDNLPLFYRLFLCWGEDCSHNTSVPTHYCHLLFAFLTFFLFASHLPERLAPGCFDYIGHSHQLFHICAVAGTHFQLEAIITDMGCRRTWLLANAPLPSLAGTLGVTLAALLLNLLVISFFIGLLALAPGSSPFLLSALSDQVKSRTD